MSDSSKTRLILGIVAMGLISIMVVWATIGLKKIALDEVKPVPSKVETLK